MRVIFISLFVFLATTSCKSKYRKAADEIVANAPAPTNMNVGTEKYSLYIPDGWTTTHRNNYGVDYYYISAPKTEDDPNTSVNVANEFMQNLSLEEYLKGTIRSIEKGIPSANILADGEILGDDLKGVWYSYNMESQGIKATIVSYIYPKDGIAYIITAGTQTKDALKYRGTFDKISKSFKFNQE